MWLVAEQANLPLERVRAECPRTDGLVKAIVDRAAGLFTTPLDAPVTANTDRERLTELLTRHALSACGRADAAARLLSAGDRPALRYVGQLTKKMIASALPSPEACLVPTRFIDSTHPSIVVAVDDLDLRRFPPAERARRLFHFVKDTVRYEFSAKTGEDEYIASNVLAAGRGFCVQKAVLLAALGRAAGVPTALVFSDLRDRSLPSWVAEALTTDVMHHHGLDAFWLDGAWVKVDASLSPDVVNRKRYRKLDFTPPEEALLAPTTLDGAPHAEYVAFHGLYADLPFDQMIAAFVDAYSRADVAKLMRFRM